MRFVSSVVIFATFLATVDAGAYFLGACSNPALLHSGSMEQFSLRTVPSVDPERGVLFTGSETV